METREKVTLGKPVMRMSGSIRMDEGEPFLWEVNGAESVRIKLDRGLKDWYYITDEMGEGSASAQPRYASLEEALASVQARIDGTWSKAYITKIKYTEDKTAPSGKVLDVWFDSHQKNAGHYATSEQAEIEMGLIRLHEVRYARRGPAGAF
ncbi:MAG: hypothetical protein WAN70_12020 [Terriglobales bacterium]